MSERYGCFNEIDPNNYCEHMCLSFKPSSVPIKQRWRNNGLSADFLGDYLTTFFPKDNEQPDSAKKQAIVRDAATYIANELLENAMKYCDENGNIPNSIDLTLLPDQLIFTEINGISAGQKTEFKAFIKELESSDPDELFMKRLEASAESDSASGLGYLTMINDYQAELGWQFDDINDACKVTTQVVIKI
ncbi:MAG: ATP-binding protein [Gammaproteobacteria bacterium]|nr:ATP-binding protein [Gammaproteobacteria bacterium]